MPLKPLLLACGLLAAGTVAAMADAAPPPTDPVDTSALRYYAGRHETARVEAEMRRLRSLHPGWQPPADPAALAETGAPSDEQPLWDLFGADKIDDLAAEIARRKAADANWAPPPDLAEKLAVKQARKALIAASDAKDYGGVLAAAAATPAVVDTADLDVAWRVADAHARSGDSTRSLAIDRAILTSNQDPAVRLATVRMALASLPQADLPGLMALGKTGPDGRSEFEPITLDLVRQRVGQVLAGRAAGDVASEDLDRLTASARSPGGAGDAALLGWLNAKRKAWGKASDWFEVALSVVPAPEKAKPDDAKVAQGRILALQGLGKQAEAEDLAWRWRDTDPAVTLLYIGFVEPDLTRPKPIAIDTERLKRFSDVVTAQQSGDGAQALGWYAYNVGQYRPAKAWFEHAMAWQPRDTTALGLGLALQKLGDRAALKAFLAENRPTFPALSAISLGRMMPGEAAPRRAPARRSVVRAEPGAADRPRTEERLEADRPQPEDGPESEARPRRPAPREAKADQDLIGCVARADQEETSGRLAPSAALRKGWCLMGLNRPQEAAMAFAAAQGGGGTNADAAYGEALAELRNQRSGAAVQAAGLAPLSVARRTEVGLAALAQSATSSFEQGRYAATLRALDQRRIFAAEPRDLTMLRAWSMFHTDQQEAAKRLFTMLDQQLSTPDTRAGLSAADAPIRN